VDVDGYGVLRRNPSASFVISVRSGHSANKLTGLVTYEDGAARLFFRSTKITGITEAGHTATITGSGLANGKPVTFVVVARDASPDTFSIQLSTGYSAADSLKKGKIRISDRCEHDRRRA
jgi:hypothetical protein